MNAENFSKLAQRLNTGVAQLQQSVMAIASQGGRNFINPQLFELPVAQLIKLVAFVNLSNAALTATHLMCNDHHDSLEWEDRVMEMCEEIIALRKTASPPGVETIPEPPQAPTDAESTPT